MLRLRTLVITVGMLSVFALVAWGCSGAGNENASDQPAAAQQPDPQRHLSTSGFRIDSASFQEKVRPYQRIPQKHTCFEGNMSPPLAWKEAPPAVKSYALIAEDVDHHTGIWVHWVLYNIPGDVTELPEGISTSTEVLPDGTTQGTNDNKTSGTTGPAHHQPLLIVTPTRLVRLSLPTGPITGFTHWTPSRACSQGPPKSSC